MNYTPNIRKSSQTFVSVLQKQRIGLPRFQKQSSRTLLTIWNMGRLFSPILVNLTLTSSSMESHQTKLLHAYEKIISKVWHGDSIIVVDYGCGQGIAEMVLSDYMASRYIDNDYIKDFILIEPSRQDLQRCVKYVDDSFNESTASAFCKKDSLIKDDDINPKSSTVIHIFSNVIDLDDFDGNGILSLLNENKSHNNIILCVSSYYQDATRGKRMKKFDEKLQGYTQIYKLEKRLRLTSGRINLSIASYCLL